MIKLFRNTRRKLLSENKLSKYLAYAIGEIFLVVVGILIALWINTKNQERINEQKAEVILKEIQRDLKNDIESSEWVVNTFITRDSIARLLLWDKLTADEMFGISSKMKPFEIVYHDMSFRTSDNGYVNFNKNLNNMPTKYNSITNDLKDLYGRKRAYLKVTNERLNSIVFENLNKVNKYDWHVESIKSGLPEKAKHYYMRDVEFKKVLLKYMNGIKNIFLRTEIYRLEAVQLHNKISEILNSDDMLPFPSPLNTSLNALALNPILGTYKLKETMSDLFPPLIELREIDNKLQLLGEGLPKVKYYWYNETTFLGLIEQNTAITNIKLTKRKPIELYVSAAKSGYAYYTKIED